MALNMNLLTVDEDKVYWPSTKMKGCTLLSTDNIKYQADLLPSEVEVILYLKCLKHKLNEKEINKLSELISNFGDEKYFEGAENASTDYF